MYLYKATHCNTLQHTATHCNTLQHYTDWWSRSWSCVYIEQHTAAHCNTLQHTATHCNTIQIDDQDHDHVSIWSNTLQHTATHCNTCNTLQHHLYRVVPLEIMYLYSVVPTAWYVIGTTTRLTCDWDHNICDVWLGPKHTLEIVDVFNVVPRLTSSQLYRYMISIMYLWSLVPPRSRECVLVPITHHKCCGPTHTSNVLSEAAQDFMDTWWRSCIYIVLQCVAVYCTVLQCVALCCSVLHCVAVRCSVLQCVAEWSRSCIYIVLCCLAVHVKGGQDS